MALNIELLLHPIRMRIIQLFIPDKELTTGQIIQLIPEVPQASLYRHLAKLVQANIVEITAENRVRGTVEKTYKLIQGDILRQDLEKMSPEEHVDAFFTFTSHLLAEFSEYVHREDMNFYKDGVSYRKASVYLDDDEYKELLQSFRKLVQAAVEKKPEAGRKLRTLATIIIPK
ncbi:MAG: helix-turn-helix domain-containing protein [Bacillota bacterium]|nr:helix-turn-helix domain-containing protein [Bacillota bacterium]